MDQVPISILILQSRIKDVRQTSPWRSRVAPGSRLSSPCCCNLWICFLIASWHGLKNSCLRASSAVILCRGFTIKHLSTRSNSDLGKASKKSGLRGFRAHQSLSFTGDKYLVSSRSCIKTVNY